MTSGVSIATDDLDKSIFISIIATSSNAPNIIGTFYWVANK
jgi:hypothetical protein